MFISDPKAAACEDATDEPARRFSIEVTLRDKTAIDGLRKFLPAGQEIFIACLPGDSLDDLIDTAVHIQQCGMITTPHIAARNITSRQELETALQRLCQEAGVKSALVIGGDRDTPIGNYTSSHQLIKTGLFQKYEFQKLYIACYPERHPGIPHKLLASERRKKLAAIREAGLNACLISQFAFEADPIIEFAMRLNEETSIPLRVGLAGPVKNTALIKYAMLCGVGSSLRALRRNKRLLGLMTNRYAPESLLKQLREALPNTSGLIDGIHIFTFGQLTGTAEWIAKLRE